MSLDATSQLSLCRKALDQYDLKVRHSEFIRHSENITFKISADSGNYLLRIHYPLSGIIDPEFVNKEKINSELQWLEALNSDSTLKVQSPVYNINGNMVSTIEHDGNTLFCSLLTWLEGTVRYEDQTYTTAQAENLGKMVAKLHDHAASWQLPSGFTRPEHNFQRLQMCLDKLLTENRELAFFDNHTAITLQKTVDKIKICYQLEQQEHNWGLVHGDICENNYLINGDEVSPIDFSLCGFGSFSEDITGSLLHIFREDMWQAYFRGYSSIRVLPENLKNRIEAFVISSDLSNWSFHCTNPLEHEWLTNSVKKFMDKYIPPFLKGESYIFSRFNIDI